LVRRQVHEAADRVGRVDDHLVRAGGRLRGEQVRVRVRLRRGGIRIERRVLVRHHADRPPGRVRRTAVRAHGVDLGRRLILVTLGERVALGVDRRIRWDLEPATGAVGALTGDDRLETRQRVDANLRHQWFRPRARRIAGAVRVVAAGARQALAYWWYV